MPEITVVIPTHNRAGYVSQAIDSVLGQTYRGAEIIVVDDGSTDDTRERVAAYGDRVKYIYTPNGGTAHARNVGMRAARGRYLTFLDSDDLYYPYALELKKRVLDRRLDVGVVYAEMSGFDDTGFFEPYYLKQYHASAYRDHRVTYERMFDNQVCLDELGVVPESLALAQPHIGSRKVYTGNIFEWYLTNLVLFTNSVMMRRDVVGSVGERNEQIKYWEETDYLMRIARHHRVCFVDVPTYKLRFHDQQISTTVRSDGRYIWVRKQQILLRLTKRHAHQDQSYYRDHRRRIDAHLANLHRAVAVPMMLTDSRDAVPQQRYLKASRLYLERCRRLGHAEWMLWLLTFTPGMVRRTGVSVVELLRSRSRSLRKKVVPEARVLPR